MNQEKNYLEQIFDNEDYESPEEKAIKSVEQVPDKILFEKESED